MKRNEIPFGPDFSCGSTISFETILSKAFNVDTLSFFGSSLSTNKSIAGSIRSFISWTAFYIQKKVS